MTQTKRCLTCGETKPTSEFYLVSSANPDGPFRAKCRDCSRAYAVAYKRNGPSLARKVQNELLKFGLHNPDALSPEVRSAVFTTRPVDPDALAASQSREKAERARAKRRQRERQRSNRPTLWTGGRMYA